MKKIIIFALLMLAFIALMFSVADGQSFCINGNGFFENHTAETDAAMAALPGRVIIGIPGGPISKLAQPISIQKGWGLDDVFTAEIFEQYPDEDGSEVDKWLQKEDQQPTHSYLNDCNDLSAEYPNEFGFVYRININSSPFEAIQAMQTLTDGGSDIVGVVLGSEVYSWLEFDFEKYISLSEPIITSVLAYYPFIGIALCAAPNPDRGDHTKWNNSLQNYRSTHIWINAVDVHLYIKGEIAGTLPDPIIIKQNTYYPVLGDYFNKGYDSLMTTKSISGRIATFKTQFPGAEIWCMEGFTTNPSAYFHNTILGAMCDFKQVIENFHQMEYTGLQSGVTPDLFGMICRSNQYDVLTGMIKRTGYFGMMLALESINSDAIPLNFNQQLNTDGGSFYFWNKESFAGAFILPVGYEIATIKIRRLSGQYLYSSSGSMQYMAKGSDKGYEIDGIDEDIFSVNSFTIPAYSFGLIEVTLHKIDIIGCTDIKATNYNPDATINSGCIYPPPVCKCTDATATNYNAIVDCADATPCTYPIVINCRKYFWEFWKPKCRK